MAQEILVTYKAEVDQLTRELDKVVAAQEEITKEQVKGTAAINKNVTAQEQAAKKVVTSTKAQEKELDKLAQSKTKAFSTKPVTDYEKSVNKATSSVKDLGKSAETSLGGAGSRIQSIGLGIAASIGAAFTVDAIIQFGKASVNAFIEAQENAEKLRFTITQVGGESEAAFQRLIDQSAKLQDITIFSDDSIQQAQNALSTFGLTATQIEELIPKLADYASATKTNIVDAAQQVGAGLQGTGREFNKLGIAVSATKSELENYNIINEEFVRFQGAAAKETETLAGQLKQQENAADELQETLGSKLAPIYVALKTALFEAALGLIGFNKAVDELNKKNIQSIEDNIIASTDKIKAAGGDVVAVYSQRIEDIKEINRKAASDIDAINNQITDRVVQLSKSKLDVAPEDDAGIKRLNDQIAAINKTIEVNEIKLKGLTKIVDVEKESAVNTERTLTVEGLRKESLSSLNKLLATNAGLNDLISKNNVKLINEELTARGKLTESLKKQQEDITKQRLENEQRAWEEFKRQLETEQSELLGILNDAEQKIKDRDALFEFQIRFKAVVEGEDAAFTEARDALFKVYQDENIGADVTSNTVEEANAKKQKAYEEYIANLNKLVGDFAIFEPLKMEEATKEVEQNWFDKNQAILQSSMELMDALQALSAQYTNNRIDEINNLKDQQIDAIDKEQEYVSEQLGKRRLSETEAAKLSEQLTNKRLQVEADAAKKSAALKKKQFNIDKAAAIIKIAINTAQGIATAFADFPYPVAVALAALIAATGAAEGALVASQPNPYKKGSKSTKEGMALVGEEGPELMFMPGGAKVLPTAQTKTYGAVLDAMYDKKFDKYVMQHYVTPALNKQKAKFENAKQTRFADNIRESIVLNGGGLTGYDLEQNRRKGFNVNNAEVIGKVIAEQLKRDIYRS